MGNALTRLILYEFAGMLGKSKNVTPRMLFTGNYFIAHRRTIGQIDSEHCHNCQ